MPYFAPPTVRRLVSGGGRLLGLYALDRGVSVVRVDGHFRRLPIPPQEALDGLEAGVDYFLGGTAAVEVSAEVAAQLEADGFTVHDKNPDQ